MGRGKIEIKRIENTTTRQVTFSKRRAGLLKKTKELAILCDAEIGLIIFSSTGKMFHYCNDHLSMEYMIKKYEKATGVRIMEREHPREELMHEMRMLEEEIGRVEMGIEQCIGIDMIRCLGYEDLVKLEQQLDISVTKVRNRQTELGHQQINNLQRKVKMLEQEHSNLSTCIDIYHKKKQQEEEEEQVVLMMNQQHHHHHHHREFMALFDEATAGVGGGGGIMQQLELELVPQQQHLMQMNNNNNNNDPYQHHLQLALHLHHPSTSSSHHTHTHHQ